jgi:hypothetical protein
MARRILLLLAMLVLCLHVESRGGDDPPLGIPTFREMVPEQRMNLAMLKLPKGSKPFVAVKRGDLDINVPGDQATSSSRSRTA